MATAKIAKIIVGTLESVGVKRVYGVDALSFVELENEGGGNS